MLYMYKVIKERFGMANVLRMTVNLKQAPTISLGLQQSDIEGTGFSQTVRLMPSQSNCQKKAQPNLAKISLKEGI